MSVVIPTIDNPNREVRKFTWANLANGDTGEPFDENHGCPTFSDKTVQINGADYGVGGTVVIEGTLDGTNYETLVDPQGNALSFQADAIETILENVMGIRPNVNAGDGDTDITVTLLAHASLQLR